MKKVQVEPVLKGWRLLPTPDEHGMKKVKAEPVPRGWRPLPTPLEPAEQGENQSPVEGNTSGTQQIDLEARQDGSVRRKSSEMLGPTRATVRWAADTHQENEVTSPTQIELQAVEDPTSTAASTVSLPTGAIEESSQQQDGKQSLPCERKRRKGRPGGPFPAMARQAQKSLNRLKDPCVLKTSVIIISLLGLALFLALFPVSVNYLEYDKIALVRSITTRVVGAQTYYPGCYVLLPDSEFVIFNSTAHFLLLEDVPVITKEPFGFKVTFAMQYFIKTDELKLLFNLYEFGYQEVFEKMILSSFKNRIVDFSLDDIRLSRKKVEQELHKVVKEKLGDFHVSVRYFQLLSLSIPQDITKRYSQQVLETIASETELLKQNWTVETKLTEKVVQSINNQAEQVLANATAQAHTIKQVASATADATLQAATTRGLKHLFTTLNITQEDHKMSLYLFNAMKDMKNLYASSDFKKRFLLANAVK